NGFNVGVVMPGGGRRSREQNRATVRQDLRPAVGGLARSQLGKQLPCAAGAWNPRQRKRSSSPRDDGSILAPTCTHRGGYARSGGEVYGHASLDGDFLKLTAREKSDPLTIGREERIAAVFRARQQRGLGLVEQSRGEKLRAIRPAGGIDQPPAVGRDRDSEIEAGHCFRAEIHA